MEVIVEMPDGSTYKCTGETLFPWLREEFRWDSTTSKGDPTGREEGKLNKEAETMDKLERLEQIVEEGNNILYSIETDGLEEEDDLEPVPVLEDGDYVVYEDEPYEVVDGMLVPLDGDSAEFEIIEL